MGRTGLDELPKEIFPRLSQLQYLNLPGCMNAPGEDLAGLELLEEFGGRFGDLHNFHKFMSSRHNYEKDWWYDILVGPTKASVRLNNCLWKLRRVIVGDCTIEAGGGEAATSIFIPLGIDILEISSCHGLSSCFVDNFLPRTTLRGLTCSISDCGDIEWIVNEPSGRDTTTDPHCISFDSLKVYDLQNLVGLCKGKIASHTFSGLIKLKIQDCDRMKKLFPRAILQDLKSLEKLVISRCYKMEEIIGREGSSQNSSSTSITVDLPNLKQLDLHYLPELKSICEGKLMCDSLEYMSFLECPKLKRMPFYTLTANEHPFPSLGAIRVCDENWWETLEWEQSHVKILFQTYIKWLVIEVS
ncbi:hypothetical protein P3L10_025388 [Capsicum annuum]